MKLYLKGHNYRYAVEQMISTLFCWEKPEYPTDRPNGDRMEISLSKGKLRTTAVCIFIQGQSRWQGRAAINNEKLTSETETASGCQFIIKNAIYRAVMASGARKMPWGALTGVRPGKLMHGIVLQEPGREASVGRFMTEYDVSQERAELCYDATQATLAAAQALRPNDICLYVGIPFCPTRCAYCSFVSQATGKSMKMIPEFLEALKQEVKAVAAQVKAQNLRVISIYMGGGTPTTLSAQQLDMLCGLLEEQFDLSALSEYCVEAGRPDTITEEKLKTLRKHGIDRISVNPQTMEDEVLQAIGRYHTVQEIRDALKLTRNVGGFAVNMDLIAGLPKDSVSGFQNSVEQVLALQPENITIHTLSLKRGSGITLTKATIPGADEVSEMLEFAYKQLKENGYRPYYLYRQKNMSGGFENTGWAKEGYVNLYNICMMEEICSILAMGGGGSTKLVHPGGGRNIRLTAPKYPQEYVEQIEKTCEEKKRISEFFFNALNEREEEK